MDLGFNVEEDLAQSTVFSEDWEEVILSEQIEINPKRHLKKGESAKFVSMADLEPFKRKIENFTRRKFKGVQSLRTVTLFLQE